MTNPFNPNYGQPTAPPPKPKRNPLGPILLCVCIGLGLVVGIGLASSSKTVTVSAPPATSPPSTAAAPLATSPSSPESAPTIAAPATTTEAPTTTTPPPPPTTSLANAVRNWVTERDVIGALTPISEALGSISDSSTPSAMKRSCQKIQAALPAYAATLPSPDPELTAEMQSTHDHLKRAAQLCIDGITYTDTADIEQAATEFAASTAATKRANAILQKYVDS